MAGQQIGRRVADPADGGAVALLVRLRRLQGAERQQTKWFAFGTIPWVAVDLAWVAVQLTSGVVLPLAVGLGSLVALLGE